MKHKFKHQTLIASIAVAYIGAVATAHAQTTYTYYTGTSNAYLSASHWLVGGTASTKFPGVDANNTSTADGTTTDIAAIGAIGFTATNGFGINFNTSANNGVSTNTGANGSLTLGAFDFLSGLASNLQIGNSSSTLSGVLTLNGGTLNGVANTIISNEGSKNVAFAPSATGTTTTPMTLALGNATGNVIQANGTGTISITTSIANGAGNSIGINGAGTGAVIFSAANTYSGGTTITAGSLLANNITGSGTGAGPVAVNGGLLGGTGTISGAVTVASGATIEGGTGAASGALTLTSPLTLSTGSIIELALGASHSTLATAGATFDPAQKFFFLLAAGATAGTYTNIITGLTSDPGTEGTWVATATDSNFMATFAFNGTNGINLLVTSVPEPTTILGGVLLVGAAGWSQRRRLRAAVLA